MPEKKTLQRARKHARQGKASSMQAGEFVREDRAYSTRQAWRSFCQAGDRNRAFEGQAGWSEAAPAQKRKGSGGSWDPGGTRLCPRKEITRPASIAHQIASD